MTSAERILDATGVDLSALFACLEPWGLTEEGGLAVEAWLAATGAPGLHAGSLASAPTERAWSFVKLLAFSRPVAAILKQNPEFASLLLEGTDEPNAPDLRASIVAEGRLLLAASISPSHRLDRLRWLRQKWSLLLADGSYGPEVWRMESDVADAMIGLARGVAWNDLHPTPMEDCPVLVVGFGKLGGRELNRSSDIDLVYVVPDDLYEATKRNAFRWAEAFGRAMETPMGRGSLYRVDLRLRPFGRTGEVARSMKGVESYYRNYAETWEIQALLRSRPISGPVHSAERWNAMRAEILGRTIWSPEKIADLIEQRERTERTADPRDLKRASGGIRDVEWIAQIGTLLGFDGAEPQTTGAMLARLSARGTLPPQEATTLTEDYGLLRRYEDALQLRDGYQTHVWPDEERERMALALALATMPETASRRLRETRDRVASLYERRLRSGPLESITEVDPASLSYVVRFSNEETYRRALGENEGSAARLRTALDRAPRFMHELRDPEILEEILSGEIVEAHEPLRGADAPTLRRSHEREWIRWALLEDRPTKEAIENALLLAFSGSGLEILVLGSVAMATHGPWSDSDLLLLHDDEMLPAEAEGAARRSLETLRALRRAGAPAAFDLRLRPDGGKGALVRSRRALVRYAEDDMAAWERLALGNALPLVLTGRYEGAIDPHRSTPTTMIAGEIASRSLSSEDRIELFAIKDRVERERSAGPSDLKLGPGGLMDAEWCVRLDETERGEFAPGDLALRARNVGLEAEVDLLVASRRRTDLGGKIGNLAELNEARARIRARLLEMRG